MVLIYSFNLNELMQPPQAFNVFDPQPVAYNSFSSVKAKDVGFIILPKLISIIIYELKLMKKTHIYCRESV
jgi:hypothetical protein